MLKRRQNRLDWYRDLQCYEIVCHTTIQGQRLFIRNLLVSSQKEPQCQNYLKALVFALLGHSETQPDDNKRVICSSIAQYERRRPSYLLTSITSKIHPSSNNPLSGHRTVNSPPPYMNRASPPPYEAISPTRVSPMPPCTRRGSGTSAPIRQHGGEPSHTARQDGNHYGPRNNGAS